MLALIIAFGAAVALGLWIVTSDPSNFDKRRTVSMGWVAIGFFGPLFVMYAHRLLLGPRVPIELSPQGFVDRRLFTNEVSWMDVGGVHIWPQKNNPLIAVQLTPEAMSSLEKTLVAKVKSRIGTTFGKNAVYLPTSDLDIKADDLLGSFQSYLKKYNPDTLAEC